MFCFCALHDTADDGAAEYEAWWAEKAAELRAALPAFRGLSVLRGDGRPAGGVRSTRFQPTHAVFVEVDEAGPLLSGEVERRCAPPVPGRIIEGSYAGPHGGMVPACLFLVAQHVGSEHEAAYDHWYEVDDGLEHAEGIRGHGQDRLSLPGLLALTRLRCIRPGPAAAVQANHLELFAIAGLDAMQTPDYVRTTRAVAPSRTKPPFELWVRHAYQLAWRA